MQLQGLMLRLSTEYPGDIGIMMPLLLNYLRMGEGESFFMAANEPHAYLKGDILEVRIIWTIVRNPRPLDAISLGCVEAQQRYNLCRAIPRFVVAIRVHGSNEGR